MRLLKGLPLLLFASFIASATPDPSPNGDVDAALSQLSSLADPLLDGLADSLAGDPLLDLFQTTAGPQPIKRQAQDPRQGLSDAFNALLPGITSLLGDGIIDQIFDLLRDGENIFTPEWNDRFGEVVDSVTPLAYDLGQFLGYLVRVILSGSFGGSGDDLPPLPTQPSFPDAPGFEWPDFTISSPDIPATSTGSTGPAPTATSSAGAGWPGLDIDTGSGDEGADADAAADADTDIDSDTDTAGWGGTDNGSADIPSTTVPDDTLFTGAAATVRLDLWSGVGLGFFGALML
ncbi:hypothetical protein BDW62DRAFT_216887 [Aspergillus aurantiobrunneus]